MNQTKITHKIEQAKHDYHLDELATKRDLDLVRIELLHDIERLRAETKQAIAQSQAETTRWLTSIIVGAAFVQIGLIAWLVQQIVQK